MIIKTQIKKHRVSKLCALSVDEIYLYIVSGTRNSRSKIGEICQNLRAGTTFEAILTSLARFLHLSKWVSMKSSKMARKTASKCTVVKNKKVFRAFLVTETDL